MNTLNDTTAFGNLYPPMPLINICRHLRPDISERDAPIAHPRHRWKVARCFVDGTWPSNN